MAKNRPLVIGYLALASIAVPAAALAGGRGASWVLGAVAVTYPVALIVLAVSAGAGAPPVTKGALALGATLGTSVAMLLLVRSAITPLVLLLGVGLVPFLLTGIVHAATFDRWGIREDDLHRLRRPRDEPREPSRS